MKTVHFEDVKEAMDQMLMTPIFETPEKRMLANISKKILDPNLVMDVRHKIFHEPLPLSPSKDLILEEAKRYNHNVPQLNDSNTIIYRNRRSQDPRFKIYFPLRRCRRINNYR